VSLFVIKMCLFIPFGSVWTVFHFKVAIHFQICSSGAGQTWLNSHIITSASQAEPINKQLLD